MGSPSASRDPEHCALCRSCERLLGREYTGSPCFCYPRNRIYSMTVCQLDRLAVIQPALAGVQARASSPKATSARVPGFCGLFPGAFSPTLSLLRYCPAPSTYRQPAGSSASGQPASAPFMQSLHRLFPLSHCSSTAASSSASLAAHFIRSAWSKPFQQGGIQRSRTAPRVDDHPSTPLFPVPKDNASAGCAHRTGGDAAVLRRRCGWKCSAQLRPFRCRIRRPPEPRSRQDRMAPSRGKHCGP